MIGLFLLQRIKLIGSWVYNYRGPPSLGELQRIRKEKDFHFGRGHPTLIFKKKVTASSKSCYRLPFAHIVVQTPPGLRACFLLCHAHGDQQAPCKKDTGEEGQLAEKGRKYSGQKKEKRRAIEEDFLFLGGLCLISGTSWQKKRGFSLPSFTEKKPSSNIQLRGGFLVRERYRFSLHLHVLSPTPS